MCTIYVMQKEQDADDADLCIRCSGQMVHVGFKIYRCNNCGHEEKPEDLM